MPIVVNIDVMMAKRKMSAKDLAKEVGITPANLSVLKTGKARAVRFSTLEPWSASPAICWNTAANCDVRFTSPRKENFI